MYVQLIDNINITFAHFDFKADLPAIQKLAAKLTKQEIKMQPRRPKALLRGLVVQQPIRAEHRYGAPFRSPLIQTSVTLNSSK